MKNKIYGIDDDDDDVKISFSLVAIVRLWAIKIKMISTRVSIYYS